VNRKYIQLLVGLRELATPSEDGIAGSRQQAISTWGESSLVSCHKIIMRWHIKVLTAFNLSYEKLFLFLRIFNKILKFL
jgi:hypothetical protein